MKNPQRSTLLSVLVLALVVALSTAFASASEGASPFESDVPLARHQAHAPVVIEATDEPWEAWPSGEQVLRMVGPVEGPETLDPALTRDLAGAFLVRQIFRGLTRFNHDLEPVPELAQRIEISADGLEYTFTLREDAAFHDGRPVTADAVVASLTRALDPATADGEAALLGGPTFLSDIEGADALIDGRADELRGVTAVDERTVRIQLAAPRSTFLMKLASAPASIVDPADVARGGEWWRTPNGSGPFRVAEWLPGSHLTLVRFEGYFRGTPSLARVEIRLGASALQPFNLYQAGQIDVSPVDIWSVDRVLAPESGLREQVTRVPLFAVDYIAFRLDTPPMDDPQIRRAIQLGFPRFKIAEVTYDNYVAPAEGFIPNGMLGVDWPAEMLPYDVEAARQAVAASSYGAPERVPPIRIFISGYTGAEALRDTVERDLGLTVEVINVEWSEFVAGLARRSYPAYELYWGADYPDPESLLLILFGSGRADNYVDYSNPAMDELLQKAAAEQDPDRRITLYARAQQLLLNDHVVIPLYFDVAYTLIRPEVKGLDVTPLGILGLETVWLER